MLKIAKEEHGYRVELFQVNRLNTLFSDLVREQLLELVEEPGTSVIFNLKDIQFIDSTGFNVLLEVADRAREAGSLFKLCNVNEEVRELLTLMELEDCFEYANCVFTREKILQVLD
jgi:anti-anti-sigma factor